jgi:hypothetical protein
MRRPSAILPVPESQNVESHLNWSNEETCAIEIVVQTLETIQKLHLSGFLAFVIFQPCQYPDHITSVTG